MSDGPEEAIAPHADFTAFAEGCQLCMVRAACLICGDRHLAEDLTQTALIKVAGCRSGGAGRALRRSAFPATLDDGVERRHQDEREQRRGEQTADDHDGEGLRDEPALPGDAERHRQQREHRRDGGHQDRPQATAATLVDRVVDGGGIVDRLAAAGHVTRREDPRDRRVRRIELTAEGTRLMDDMIVAGDEHHGRLLERLTLEELGIIERAMAIMQKALDAEETGAEGTAK